MEGSETAQSRGGKRKRSRIEEERREARVARDFADPRWKKIRISRAGGVRKKWKSGVVIGGKRGKAATHGASGSASLVLYEDGEERVEDLDAVEWEERGKVGVQLQPAAGAKSGGRSSKYRGLSWDKRGKKWRASTKVDGKTKNLGSFADEIAAARAYDAFVIIKKLNKPLNFPGSAAAKGHVVTSSKTSRYRGVSLQKSPKKWKVVIRVNGKLKHLGSFRDEEKAGRAFDKYIVDNNLDRPLNFPVAAEEEDGESSSEDESLG